MQLLQQLKRLICDLCRLYNLPQHPDVEMLDQPLPAGPISQDKKVAQISTDLHSLITLLPFLLSVWAYASFLSLFFPAWNNRWSDIRRRGGRGNGRGIKLQGMWWVPHDSSFGEDKLIPNTFFCLLLWQQDIEDLDHYDMKEEEPVDGKKSEDDGIEKENLAILEKIRKNQRQDHLNVSVHSVRYLFIQFWGWVEHLILIDFIDAL